MVAWIGIYAGYRAGSALWNGFKKRDAYRDAARNERAFARYNSQQVRESAQANASLTMTAASTNATMLMATGQIEAQTVFDRAQYNAEMVRVISQYNAKLYDDEADAVYQGLELDIELAQQERSRERGSIAAGYAHGGIELNTSDVYGVALLDSYTKQYLDEAIMRHNADVRAASYLNAAAKSRWEGRIQSDQIMWDGLVGASTSWFNATTQAQSGMTQAAMDSISGLYNAENKADAIIYGAELQSNQYDTQGSYAIMEGLMNGINSTASFYGA